MAYPVQRDDQESIAPLGVLPGMTFTPDSKYLLASYGGKIWKLSVASEAPSEIAFEAGVNLEVGPRLYFNYPVKDTAYALGSQIRDAVPSPDGSKLAFTSLNRLYVMDYPNGTPKRLTNHNFVEAMPAWNPNGTALAFVTWNDNEGGSLYTVNADGSNVKRLVQKLLIMHSQLGVTITVLLILKPLTEYLKKQNHHHTMVLKQSLIGLNQLVAQSI